MSMYLLSQFLHRPVRALGVMAGVALGAALFLTLAALGTGFHQAAQAPLQGVAADLLVTRPAGEGTAPPQTTGAILPFGTLPFDADELDRVRAITDVADAAGDLEIWDFGAGGSANKVGAQYQVVVGVDLTRPEVGQGKALSEGLSAGRLFEPAETGVAIADRHYAALFSLKPGDDVTISQQKYKLVGIAEQKGVSQAGVANLYVPLAEAQRLANLPAGQVNQIYVRADDASKVDAIVAELNARLGPVSAMSQESILQVMGGVARISAQFSTIAGLVGMAGGWALAWVALTGLMAERMYEVGVMKAVGWRRREVIRVFLLEFFILGLSGGLLGIMLGLGFTFVMGYLPAPSVALSESLPGVTAVAASEEVGRLQVHVTPNELALALLIAISGVLVAGWLSIRGVSKLKPSQILRGS